MTKHKKAEEPKMEGQGSSLSAEELNNKYLRALADCDNLKKQQSKEREQFLQFANENLILELLPVVDNFGRAMKSVEGNEEVTKGLALTKKQLEDVLKKHGAEEIEAVGQPFDPNFHEAILTQAHDGPENTIIEEAQKGYRLKGKVIRPSMVIVSKIKEGK